MVVAVFEALYKNSHEGKGDIQIILTERINTSNLLQDCTAIIVSLSLNLQI
jgi:hypothetical protein